LNYWRVLVKMHKLSDIIKHLEFLKNEHGDLLCFDIAGQALETFDVTLESGKAYPTAWDMPEKFIKIGSD